MSVVRVLRGQDIRLTVIVSIADEGRHDGAARHRITGAAVEDLRRSLEAMAGEEGALLRAIRRPLTIQRLGRHPLGSLVIASVVEAFGDYGRASTWLGEQLEIGGAVLPATVGSVELQIESVADGPKTDPSDGSEHRLRRLRFVGERVESPAAAVAAIEQAQWVLLAPGSLYRSVLATAAVPDLVAAVRRTHARVLWIPNLAPDSREAANMTAIDHLLALRLHGIRVDAVMHDPAATLGFDGDELASYAVEPVPRELRRADNPARHDPERLHLALAGWIGSRPPSAIQRS